MISEIVERDERFLGIFLTRNFGHQAAVSIGLLHARGSVVAIIDADLQDPPEAIGSLIAQLEVGERRCLTVCARKRKEGVLKRWAYFLFYRLLRFVSMIDVPLDSGDFCCMRRRVVTAMLSLPRTQPLPPRTPPLGRVQAGRRGIRARRPALPAAPSTRCENLRWPTTDCSPSPSCRCGSSRLRVLYYHSLRS